MGSVDDVSPAIVKNMAKASVGSLECNQTWSEVLFHWMSTSDANLNLESPGLALVETQVLDEFVAVVAVDKGFPLAEVAVIPATHTRCCVHGQ